ncbi:MAG: prepilin-type N-terminal cleavage/methylation domain-containing protein [Verrucomicrobiales bacterium]|nr:prepilin-type N-terminal cleavage/methylation domain-containing protein [Verrucomicrobiales bacterium]MCP5560708.1 prepilin-type N-terminal cleavage/methylation domain-containing protein [Verrucomicrobiaceae bacterium]
MTAFLQGNVRCSCRQAFSLLEQLIVLVIIAILLMAGLSFQKTPMGERMSAAEQFVGSKIREARFVAVMRSSNARLLVHTDPDQPDYCWRAVTIVAETEPGSGEWHPVGLPERLPPGIVWADTATAGPHSGKSATLPEAVSGWASGAQCLSYEFEGSGRTADSSYVCRFGLGGVVDGKPVFKDRKDIRGIWVSAYGFVSELPPGTEKE